MSESAIKTKYGNARLNEWGYYQISTRKEGNHNKLLHRVIFENFYGFIPDGYHIHHKDGNITNNCILNLQLMRESTHISLHTSGKNHHFYGKSRPDETKQKIRETMRGVKNSDVQNRKISKARNTTGFMRVFKRTNKKYPNGFLWAYVYYPECGKRQKTITSINLLKLKEKVITKGLKWEIINEDKALQVCKEYGYDEELLL